MKKVLDVDGWIQLARNIKTDDALRAKVNRAPLDYLESISVEVEDCFKVAVEKHLKSVSGGACPANTAQPPAGSFVFTANVWGLVLVINEQGMQWLKTVSVDMIGQAILAALTVLAESTSIPLVDALMLIGVLWCGIQAAWLVLELVAMLALDEAHHKGIYLTWTWLWLAATCYIPFPTAIE